MKKTLLGLILTVFFSSCLSLQTSEYIIASFKKGPFDAIIVPGCPFNVPEYEGLLISRITWSKYIWEIGMTENILYSGSAVYTPWIESRIMREAAICMNVDSNIIYTEEDAEHSTENIFYSVKYAEKMGWKNIALATDPWQAGYLEKVIEEQGYEIAIIPIDYSKLRTIEFYDLPIDPSSAYVEDFVPITDTLTKEQIKANSAGARVFKTN
ncbi:YdcF family protein [bacterium SCSIO 12741]|nr:YdcF family protein [bacterium SCSIO 12741]